MAVGNWNLEGLLTKTIEITENSSVVDANLFNYNLSSSINFDVSTEKIINCNVSDSNVALNIDDISVIKFVFLKILSAENMGDGIEVSFDGGSSFFPVNDYFILSNTNINSIHYSNNGTGNVQFLISVAGTE